MGARLHCLHGTKTQNQGATSFTAVFDGDSPFNGTESNRSFIARTLGVYDYLTVKSTAFTLAGGATKATLTFRFGATLADGAQTVDISAANTTVQDTTHSDSPAAADLIALKSVAEAGLSLCVVS